MYKEYGIMIQASDIIECGKGDTYCIFNMLEDAIGWIDD